MNYHHCLAEIKTRQRTADCSLQHRNFLLMRSCKTNQGNENGGVIRGALNSKIQTNVIKIGRVRKRDFRLSKVKHLAIPDKIR